jgi:hypothetical protein
MKKKMRLLSAALLATVLSTSAVALASDLPYGASAAAKDEEYTLEEMLTYAIQDEYLARATYQSILDKYGPQRPFSNIVKAEERHISMLLPLFEAHDLAVPADDALKLVVVPESVEAAYPEEIEAEKVNIAMYEDFLKEDLPEDVALVFERLENASENHLKAFENAAAGNIGTGAGNRRGAGNSATGNVAAGNAGVRGRGGARGEGAMNRNNGAGLQNPEDCLLP